MIIAGASVFFKDLWVLGIGVVALCGQTPSAAITLMRSPVGGVAGARAARRPTRRAAGVDAQRPMPTDAPAAQLVAAIMQLLAAAPSLADRL